MRSLILIAADDAQLRATLARWLMSAGYAVELADSAKRAREILASQPVALTIVEPSGFGDGGAALAREAAAATGGLLLVEAKGPDGSFGAPGADGRIRTPLEMEDVLARVQAALPAPASEPAPAGLGVLRFDGHTLNVGARTCVTTDGRDVGVTRAEFALLLCLIDHAGRVASRERLSEAAAGRDPGPDNRTVDVLISRLRRKIEPDPKEPRLIVTVPGEGYRFAARVAAEAVEAVEAPVAPPAGASDIPPAGAAAPAGQSVGPALVRRRFASAAMIGTVGAVAAAAVVAIALWMPRGGVPVPASQAPSGPARRFDAAVIPFVSDAARRELASYPTQPDYKALALWVNGWEVVYAASSAEDAKAQAMQRCRLKAKNIKICAIYAVGMDVVWPQASPPMPLRSDRHEVPLDLPLVAAQLVPLDAQARNGVTEGYMRVGAHKALAVTRAGQTWGSYKHDSAAEAIRLTVEKCGEAFATPCLLVAVDNKLTVEIPKTRQIVGFFVVTSEPGLNDAERAQIDQVYRGADWRALARGAGGGWYPVANAASEQAAVDGALASCAQRDSGCRLYAIGSFRVGDGPPAPDQDHMVLASTSAPARPFDAMQVPLLSAHARAALAAYPQGADFKAVAIATDGAWGTVFGASDRASAERQALAQCQSLNKVNKSCRLYAVGMNVMWTERSLPLPMRADIREPLDVALTADALPIAGDADRESIKKALEAPAHAAYAIKSILPIHGYGIYASETAAEAVRIVTERCADYYHSPCLLLAVDAHLTVQVPKTHKVTGLFMLTTETQMSAPDRQRVAAIYAQKDWRALARGAKGGWYPVANAASEAAAVEAAMAACAQHEGGCHLYAISNFRVADE